MPRPRDHDRHDDPDDEYDLPEGVYHDDDAPAAACPYCREPLYEGASYCVKCENFVSREDAPAGTKPAWVWACLVFALLAAVWWAVGR